MLHPAGNTPAGGSQADTGAALAGQVRSLNADFRDHGAGDVMRHAPANPGRGRLDPPGHWSPGDLRDYIARNRLPRHPLVARGYPSIGCKPGTIPVTADEDPRAGRWRTNDTHECGIHLAAGRAPRGKDTT